jgi:HKD family nuclease
MAKKDFILQGLTSRTHLKAIQGIFGISNIKNVIISVAFLTESGVDLLATEISTCAAKVTVFAGIRNDITSYQGMSRLLGLGVKLYSVDTGSRHVLFHPKLYLVRGQTGAGLVIGSANLTLGGLNNNIEAGLGLDFDLTDEKDKKVVDAIETQFKESMAEFPDHIAKVTATLLKEMLASGRLVDEMAMPPPRPATAAKSGSKDTTPRIKLNVAPLRKKLTVATKLAAKKTKPAPKAKGAAPAAPGVEFETLWESKALTRRDLTIPTAANTHATGSINLDKGLLDASVDQRHYFRDEVFENLPWEQTKNPDIEEVYAKFQLVMKGVSFGEFDLRISHNTSTTSKTYLQKNAMTRLSWGPMRPFIAKEDLIGRTISLYRDKAALDRFVLEID